jgi:hypothetical protein
VQVEDSDLGDIASHDITIPGADEAEAPGSTGTATGISRNWVQLHDACFSSDALLLHLGPGGKEPTRPLLGCSDRLLLRDMRLEEGGRPLPSAEKVNTVRHCRYLPVEVTVAANCSLQEQVTLQEL